MFFFLYVTVTGSGVLKAPNPGPPLFISCQAPPSPPPPLTATTPSFACRWRFRYWRYARITPIIAMTPPTTPKTMPIVASVLRPFFEGVLSEPTQEYGVSLLLPPNIASFYSINCACCHFSPTPTCLMPSVTYQSSSSPLGNTRQEDQWERAARWRSRRSPRKW